MKKINVMTLKINVMTLKIILVMLWAFFLIFIVVIQPKIKEYKALKYYVEYFSIRYLRIQGGTSLYHPPNWDVEKDGEFFHYDIRSWDGGKNWYAIDYNFNTQEIKIIGDVNSLYPGLLGHVGVKK